MGGAKPQGFGFEVCRLRLPWNRLRGVSGGEVHHMGTGQPPRGEDDAVEDKCSFEPWGGGDGVPDLALPLLCYLCCYVSLLPIVECF